MITSVIILAAGEARRFGGVRKQLLSIGDETILERICRQVTMRGHIPAIAVRDDEIALKCKCFPCIFESVGETATTCDSLLEMRDYWDDQTIVLLGDVIYSKPMMDTIFGETSPVRVFGNTWEIYAVEFRDSATEGVLRALKRARSHRLGKLRYFYKAYLGKPLDCQEIDGQPLEEKVFKYKSMFDFTTDVDTQGEYDNFLREVIKTNRLDDLKPKKL